MIKIIEFVLLTFYSTSILAEYRVYQYFIKNKMSNEKDNQYYTLTSTLDPQSYLKYHGGTTALNLHLMRTWICQGSTSKKNYCSSPYDQMKKNEMIKNQQQPKTL